MKIRIGFVSNSSSSSFVLAGEVIDFDDITLDMLEKKNICCIGKYLSEGEDYFKLTKDIFNFLKKSPESVSIYDDLEFYDVATDGENDIEISQQDFRGKEKLLVVSFTADQNSTSSLQEFKENYLNED